MRFNPSGQMPDIAPMSCILRFLFGRMCADLHGWDAGQGLTGVTRACARDVFWYSQSLKHRFSWVTGFQGSGVPGFLGSGVPGFLGSWVPGFRGSGVPGFLGSGVPGFRGSGVPGFRGFLGSGVPGFRGSWVPGFLGSGGSWVPGFLGSGVPGFRAALLAPTGQAARRPGGTAGVRPPQTVDKVQSTVNFLKNPQKTKRKRQPSRRI